MMHDDMKPKLKNPGLEVKRIREEVLKLSSLELSRGLNVSVRTVQAWEQGINSPEGPALTYLQHIQSCRKAKEEFKERALDPLHDYQEDELNKPEPKQAAKK